MSRRSHRETLTERSPFDSRSIRHRHATPLPFIPPSLSRPPLLTHLTTSFLVLLLDSESDLEISCRDNSILLRLYWNNYETVDFSS